jgi:hypothetical protein
MAAQKSDFLHPAPSIISVTPFALIKVRLNMPEYNIDMSNRVGLN